MNTLRIGLEASLRQPVVPAAGILRREEDERVQETRQRQSTFATAAAGSGIAAAGKQASTMMSDAASDSLSRRTKGLGFVPGQALGLPPYRHGNQDNTNSVGSNRSPLTTSNVSAPSGAGLSSTSSFTLQKLRLDRANAPLISKPTAPFAKNERKRALLNASYYSECFLNSIPPVEADTAALDAQSRYEKWWVNSKFRAESSSASAAIVSSDRLGDEAKGGAAGCAGGPVKHRTKRQRTESDSTGGSVVGGRSSSSSRRGDSDDGYGACVTSEDESSNRERQRKHRCRHFDGSQDEAASRSETSSMIREVSVGERIKASEIAGVKDAMIANLMESGGDTTTAKFAECLETLHSYYRIKGRDVRWHDHIDSPVDIDGTWLTLSKPTYSECLGTNEKGQPRYTLGRMSFDMFRPTNLKCSVQGIFNMVSVSDDTLSNRPRSLPRRLQKGYGPNAPPVRNYE